MEDEVYPKVTSKITIQLSPAGVYHHLTEEEA
ncbi:unnamed protein product, partial [marine sediment metagenome]